VRRGRGALALGAGACALWCATSAAQAAPRIAPPPFSAASAFNQRLPLRPVAASNGIGLRSVPRSVNYTEYTPIVYTATPNGTPYQIKLTQQGPWGRNALDGVVVRVRPGVIGGSDGDGHVTIVVPYEDRVISLYQAEPAPRPDGTWWATWGGIAPLSGDGANFAGSRGGRESGISQLAGLITPADVRRGIAAGPHGDLGHALSVGYPVTHSTRVVPPATVAGAGNSETSAALYMGQKIYLDPRLDLSRVRWRVPGSTSAKSIRFSRLVARTLQRYGAIVLTNSPALSFQLVNPRSWTAFGRKDPWPALIGPSAGGYYGFAVRRIPRSALHPLAPSSTVTVPRQTEHHPATLAELVAHYREDRL
jgi:hypothetical protein